MDSSIKTPGLLLQEIPYLGKKKILKVLTEEFGLISLITNQTALTPFCLAEWVYRKTSKELHTLQDATLIDPLLELRSSYTLLTAAGSIAKDLLQTQMPGKKSPYLLAAAYLKKLPLNPLILTASFKLKLLQHEGLLSPEPDPSFTPAEWEEVACLAFAQTFSLLLSQKTAPLDKIDTFFRSRIEEG